MIDTTKLRSKGMTPFRAEVLDAWSRLGPDAKSREVADLIWANETRTSNAMCWLESNGYSPNTPPTIP